MNSNMLAKAIIDLGGECFSVGSSLDTLDWKNGDAKGITNNQIIEKYNELVEADKKIQYQRDRLQEYPDLQDCIHALLDGGNTLTELQSKRSEIKQKYPKPT